MVEGEAGEFAVLVGDRVVIRKGFVFKPSEAKVVAAVRAALGAGG